MRLRISPLDPTQEMVTAVDNCKNREPSVNRVWAF